MRTRKLAILAIALVALGTGAAAQQLETNDAGGTLLIDGSATPNGSPAVIDPLDNAEVTVQGGNLQPLLLVGGNRADISFCPPALSGECLDLEMASIFEIVNGFSGSPFGVLNSNGEVLYSFPVNFLPTCGFGFQALVADPTIPPIFVNFTAAGMIEISGDLQFSGDDEVETIDLCIPANIYGTAYTQMHVSTNGWVKFGAVPTFSDFSESTADFTSGNVGNAGVGSGPVIAALWDDLFMTGQADNSFVVVERLTPSITRVTWQNTRFFDDQGTNIGDIELLINSTGPVQMDWSGMNLLSPQARGLVGISPGNDLSFCMFARNFAVNGNFPPFALGDLSFCSGYRQNFNPGAPGSDPLESESFDLAGLNNQLLFVPGTQGGYNIN